jgi:hypothetical protein
VLHADRLRRVDEEKHVAFAACLAERFDVGSEPRRERYRGDRCDTRPLVHAFDDRVDGDVPVACRHHAHFDPVALEVEPRVDVVRMLELGAQHHVLAAMPVDRRRDHVETVRDVLGVRDLVGLGSDQLREATARTLDQLEEVRLVSGAVHHPIVEVRVERRAHFARKDATRRHVHVDPARERRKVAACFGEHDAFRGFVHDWRSFP